MNRTHRKLWIHAGRHKTGSSAIQTSLHRNLCDPLFDYLNVGKPNASFIINNAFNPDVANIASGDSADRTLRAKHVLQRAIEKTSRPNAILSAESISLLGENQFRALIELLNYYFDDIELLAYFRPPKSDMESAYAERLKTGFTTCDTPVKFMHRRRFEAFERCLDPSKIRYFRYAPEDFPGGNVVTHFCQQIGVNLLPASEKKANHRLSLPAVRLLYIYRSRFRQQTADDRLLIERLAELKGPPLRFHSSLFRNNFQDPIESFSWLEKRCGSLFSEDIYADDEQGIKGEMDLLLIDRESRDWLAQNLELDQVELDKVVKQPGLVAEMIHSKRWRQA